MVEGDKSEKVTEGDENLCGSMFYGAVMEVV